MYRAYKPLVSTHLPWIRSSSTAERVHKVTSPLYLLNMQDFFKICDDQHRIRKSQLRSAFEIVDNVRLPLNKANCPTYSTVMCMMVEKPC